MTDPRYAPTPEDLADMERRLNAALDPLLV